MQTRNIPSICNNDNNMNTITINLHSTFFQSGTINKNPPVFSGVDTEVGAEDLMQLLKNYSRQQGTQMKVERLMGDMGAGSW